MNIGIKPWNNEMMKIACLSQQRSRFDSRSVIEVGFVV